MRRIMYTLFATISAVVLLFSYHTSTQPQAAGSTVPVATPAQTVEAVEPVTGTTSRPRSSTTTSGSGGGTDPAATPSASTSASAATAKSYDGGVVQTRWGPVQVRITVAGGKITTAEALQYPDGDGHSSRISSFAIPTLNQQAVTAQSAELDGVSGATYTTQGYEQSLQSAIDAAGL